MGSVGADPTPMDFQSIAITVSANFPKWTLRDSNPEPHGYEPYALTNCAKSPNNMIGCSAHRNS